VAIEVHQHEVACRAPQLNAAAVILSHHTLELSRADIAITTRIEMYLISSQ
jgi:DNA repair protein RadC